MSTILITGASRGIGRAIAVEAARSGRFHKIIINSGKSLEKLEETRDTISSITDAEVIISSGDTGDIAYVEQLRAVSGPVDVLVNNAAISYVGLLTDMTPTEWSELINTNITSLYNTCHTFVPDMISKKTGHIINISSVWGEDGASCEVAYSTSKGAVNSFTRALAKELAPTGIQVNAIAPGIVDTSMNGHLSDEEISDICDSIPAGRMAKAEEIATAVIKLLDMPGYMTGEIIRMDGGWI